MKITDDIIRFLKRQKIVIVSTLDGKGGIHCSVKDIVGIEAEGKIFIIDLFKNKTYEYVKKNPVVSVTAVNEQEFKGYTFQGKAKIVAPQDIAKHIVKEWEDKIVKRISDRMIRGVQRGVKSGSHFEAKLPQKPEYLIEIDVDQVIDLSPPDKR